LLDLARSSIHKEDMPIAVKQDTCSNKLGPAWRPVQAGNAVDKARGTNQLIGLTNGEFNYV